MAEDKQRNWLTFQEILGAWAAVAVVGPFALHLPMVAYISAAIGAAILGAMFGKLVGKA